MISSENNGDDKVVNLSYKVDYQSIFLAISSQKQFGLPQIPLLKLIPSTF